MPENYTTSELGIMLNEMKKDTSETLERIEAKVTQTNGRVSKLELWKQFLLGAWAVLSILTPVIWYFVYQQVETYNNDIDSRIIKAIELNNEKYFDD